MWKVGLTNSYQKLVWGPNMDREGKVGRQADNACDLFDLLEKVQTVTCCVKNVFTLYLDQVAMTLFFILEVLETWPPQTQVMPEIFTAAWFVIQIYIQIHRHQLCIYFNTLWPIDILSYFAVLLLEAHLHARSLIYQELRCILNVIQFKLAYIKTVYCILRKVSV